MNKDIEVEQCTIMWYIYDIKKPPKYPKVVTTIIDLIGSVYDTDFPLTATRGKVQEYLGMNTDFS